MVNLKVIINVYYFKLTWTEHFAGQINDPSYPPPAVHPVSGLSAAALEFPLA